MQVWTTQAHLIDWKYMAKPQYLIVHHTGGTDANPLQDSSNFTFIQCDDLHKERFNMMSSMGYWCGYQYYIEKDGTLYQARKDDEEGAHTKGYNSVSIGICLAGNFDATLPTEAQKKTLKALLEKKMKEWAIPKENIVPHRRFATKTCFGKKLADDWAQKLVTVPEAPKPMTKDEIKKEIIRLIGLL